MPEIEELSVRQPLQMVHSLQIDHLLRQQKQALHMLNRTDLHQLHDVHLGIDALLSPLQRTLGKCSAERQNLRLCLQ